jgi:hypothetical protein
MSIFYSLRFQPNEDTGALLRRLPLASVSVGHSAVTQPIMSGGLGSDTETPTLGAGVIQQQLTQIRTTHRVWVRVHLSLQRELPYF